MSLPILSESPLPILLKDVQEFQPKKVEEHSFAVIFDNFLRDKVTFELIKSIQIYYPTVKIYIAEQGIFNPVKDLLYKKLQEAGHEIIYCGFDAGLSVCRNSLVNYAKEPYLFYCDSDNLFIKETKIETLLTILEENPTVGLVSCYEYKDAEIWHYENNLDIVNRIVKYHQVNCPEDKDYFFCDMTMNVGLLRKELFKDIQWDNRMKLAEHAHFFLSLKYKTNWKVACSSKVFVSNQNFVFDNSIYKAYRGRNQEFWLLYRDIWNVDSIDGWTIPKELTKQITDSKITEVIIQVPVPADINSGCVQFLNKLKKYKGIFWLLKESCLDCFKSKKFTNHTLYLGVKNKDAQDIFEKLYKENSYPFQLNITVELTRSIKPYDISGISVYVPCPVKDYLTATFNKSWEELVG